MADEVTYSMVFKNADFMKLLTAQIFSNSGDAIFQIAVYLYMYAYTKSLTLTTSILALQLVPWIIVGPVTGVLADRISRKGIMLFADLLRAVAIVLIPLQSSIVGIGIIVFLFGVASSSFAAPRSAAIPEIVGMKLFVKAISLSQLLFQSIRVIGPLAAAGVYILLGVNTFYYIGIVYLFSFFFVFRTVIPSTKQVNPDLSVISVMQDLGSGFSYLFHQKVIQKLLILFAIIIVGSSFANNLIYPFILEILHSGDVALTDVAKGEFGIIGGIGAVGSIIGNLLFGRYESTIGRRFAIFSGAITMGIYFVLFMLITNVLQLAVLALLSGIFGGMLSLAVNAIFAETVPNELRGRAYSATNSYVQIIAVVATSASGIIADTIGIVETIFMAGGIIVLFITLMAVSSSFFAFAQQLNNMDIF